MGAIEEGGKAVVGIVDGLKQQPMALALIVINILFLGMFVWVIHILVTLRTNERAQNQTIIEELKKTCDACRSKMGN